MPKLILPDTFRSLLWSHDFDKIDPLRLKKPIVVQTLNYGTLDQWRWLIKSYGREGVREVLTQISASELKPRALRVAALVFGVHQSIMHREVLTKRAAELFPTLATVV